MQFGKRKPALQVVNDGTFVQELIGFQSTFDEEAAVPVEMSVRLKGSSDAPSRDKPQSLSRYKVLRLQVTLKWVEQLTFDIGKRI